MANRVQEDHKLIVGIEGSRSGDVPSHFPKDSIPGKRGIVYFNADGSSQSTSGNTPGVDEDGNKEEGTTQPDAGGAGAGTSGGEYNSGNKATDAGLSDPYPVDDPAQPGSGIFSVDGLTLGDVVNGVTGLKDCATDQPVDVRFDGQFTAPDGWDNPDAPPPDPTYTEGYFWRVQGGNITAIAPTRKAAAEQWWDSVQATWPGLYPYRFAGTNHCGNFRVQANTTYSSSYSGFCDKNFSAADYVHDSGSFPGAGQYYGGYIVTPTQVACSGSGYESNSSCNPSAEDIAGESEWPGSKPMQLSYNTATGQYETHPMDTNVTPAYSQPVGSFQLCNQAGEQIESYAQTDGGQALYNATTGIATFIDSTGKVTGFGDAQSITNGQPR